MPPAHKQESLINFIDKLQEILQGKLQYNIADSGKPDYSNLIYPF